MSEAFRCDGCRNFFSGSPACRLDFQGDTFTDVGEQATDKIRLKHNGGVNDAYPKGDRNRQVRWPLWATTNIDLCVGCSVKLIREQSVTELIGDTYEKLREEKHA